MVGNKDGAFVVQISNAKQSNYTFNIKTKIFSMLDGKEKYFNQFNLMIYTYL